MPGHSRDARRGGGQHQRDLRADGSPRGKLIESPIELLAVVAFGAVAVVVAAFALIAVGLLVVAISKLVGAALPTVPDDPDRVEVLGLLQLAAYGLGAAALLTAVGAVGWRVASPQLRPRLADAAGRVALVVLCGLLAAGGVIVGIEDWNPVALLSAVGFAYGAVRAARGLAFDDDDGG